VVEIRYARIILLVLPVFLLTFSACENLKNDVPYEEKKLEIGEYIDVVRENPPVFPKTSSGTDYRPGEIALLKY